MPCQADLGGMAPGAVVWRQGRRRIRVVIVNVIRFHEFRRLVTAKSLVLAGRYALGVSGERSDLDWLALVETPLSAAEVHDWAVRPECGAVVLFSGTVRDHAEENGELREGVTHLVYEAYEDQVSPKFRAIADEARRRWPTIGRVALLHRTGRLELGESSVMVAVSAPHRPEAFEAARWAIDAVKASAPVWKHETWMGGSAWGTGASMPVDPSRVPSA